MNVASQETDPNSILNYFRKIVKLRKQEPTLIYGDWALVDADNPSVFAYTRSLNGKKLLVLLNFKAINATFNSTGIDMSKAKVLIGNYPTPSFIPSGVNGQLKAYEAVILEL